MGQTRGVILAAGTDIVDVGRLGARLGSTPALARRLFTPAELKLCGQRTDSLAARLAAKEAVLKALGSALDQAPPQVRALSQGAWRLRDIEVVSAPGSAPRLELHQVASQVAAGLGVRRWHLSLAHDGGRALAFVVAEG